MPPHALPRPTAAPADPNFGSQAAPLRRRRPPSLPRQVGARNHRYFVLFVCAVVVLTAAVLATSAVVGFTGLYFAQLARACQRQGGGRERTGDGEAAIGVYTREECREYSSRPAGLLSPDGQDLAHLVAIGLALYTFMLVWAPLSLACYHLQLVAEDSTTNERLRPPRSEPQERQSAPRENCRRFFCTPPRASHFESPDAAAALGSAAVPLVARAGLQSDDMEVGVGDRRGGGGSDAPPRTSRHEPLWRA